MRYDGMIRTILATPATDAGSRTATWRQLVDILAQSGDRLTPGLRATAHDRIAELRDVVPVSERRQASASLAPRVDRADVVAIFAMDEPTVAAPVLARATLPDAEWIGMLSLFPATSRAVLRNRRDLGGAVERALTSFGPSDFALPDWSAPPTEAGSQIRNLVARIEAFRSQKASEERPARIVEPAPDTFVFETMPTGEIDWVAGAAREPLIGMSIAEPALAHDAGVDGQAVGAHRRRAPFADARLVVAGKGPISGNWLISGAPIFNPRDGRFAGYHGTARRPRRDEHAGELPKDQRGVLSGTALPADSLRQLVHELRTPLNAIQGFADMIDCQILGPAGSAYRTQAHGIAKESRRLLEVVDDLDTAARLDSDSFDREEGASDVGAILQAIVDARLDALESRGIVLRMAIEPDSIVAIAGPLVERMMQRLLASSFGLLGEGDAIDIRLASSAGRLDLNVTRPANSTGRNGTALLDPISGVVSEWLDAPILGMGFTLRLVANLARAAGATLVVREDGFRLSLPVAAVARERSSEQI